VARNIRNGKVLSKIHDTGIKVVLQNLTIQKENAVKELTLVGKQNGRKCGHVTSKHERGKETIACGSAPFCCTGCSKSRTYCKVQIFIINNKVISLKNMQIYTNCC
jgi:hypothetical protein